MSDASILVVDDDPIVRRLLVRRLELDGYAVTAAAGGTEALALLGSQHVDLVLLDVLMPDVDGYAVLERIRATERLRHLPVVVISAVDDMTSAVRCIELGADDYLSKPVDATLLRARMRAGLVRKRLHDLQQEYIEQVGVVAEAAAAVEDKTFEPERLAGVAARDDALGRLARVFARMASEVRARELALEREVTQLKIEIDRNRTERKVQEITDTDFFRNLETRVSELRER
ncbi:MAG TPA: response regulator [Baekduia sp.]|nr:response regulator [Baekduia sp.]